MVEAGAQGSTTLYAWAGGSVIAEYNGVGNGMAWTKSYVYLGGRLLATEVPLTSSTTETKYQHPDRLGTRLVTNTSGGVVSENIGLPFGTILAGESTSLGSSATKKRFTSYDRSDSTTLDYAVNRHYSAAQGRFTQVDPIGMNAVSLADPQSLNLYAYCGNDPINQIDPDGLFSFRKLFGAIGKAMKWIAIAAIVAVAILTFVAPAALASLSIWAANHATLAALIGINTPHFAIINLAATTLGASASLGFRASIAASVGTVRIAVGKKQKKRESNKKPRRIIDKFKEAMTANLNIGYFTHDKNVNKAEICSDISELIAREAKDGTIIASKLSRVVFPLGPNPLHRLMHVTIYARARPIDLDWMIHIYSNLSTMPGSAAGNYLVYKSGWVIAQKLFLGEEPTNAIPFSDEGEKNAVLLIRDGVKYSDTFTTAWMRKNCPK